jgi:3-oxoacyl-[acyl-carrier-protein] synthase III
MTTSGSTDAPVRKTRPLAPLRGVEIAGTGSSVPPRRLTNAELEKVMDTSDEWILQRTGIRERRISDPAKGENVNTLSAEALRRALHAAGLQATDLDLILVCTVSMEMTCPSAAALVSEMVGAGRAGTADITSACAGFVYGLNMGHDLVRAGSYGNVAVIGADLLTRVADYSTEGRGVAILCGDAAGAVILRSTPDLSKGIIAQAMHSDGNGWKHLFIPRHAGHFPPNEDPTGKPMNKMYMNGREVFKFAVGTFSDLIQETLDKAGLTTADVDQFICHQSNARILDAARDRFGLPKDKLYINIDRYGNSSSGSVPLCLDELVAAGRVKPGDTVMFVAFGGGLTWASSLWQL